MLWLDVAIYKYFFFEKFLNFQSEGLGIDPNQLQLELKTFRLERNASTNPAGWDIFMGTYGFFALGFNLN